MSGGEGFSRGLVEAAADDPALGRWAPAGGLAGLGSREAWAGRHGLGGSPRRPGAGWRSGVDAHRGGGRAWASRGATGGAGSGAAAGGKLGAPPAGLSGAGASPSGRRPAGRASTRAGRPRRSAPSSRQGVLGAAVHLTGVPPPGGMLPKLEPLPPQARSRSGRPRGRVEVALGEVLDRPPVLGALAPAVVGKRPTPARSRSVRSVRRAERGGLAQDREAAREAVGGGARPSGGARARSRGGRRRSPAPRARSGRRRGRPRAGGRGPPSGRGPPRARSRP